MTFAGDATLQASGPLALNGTITVNSGATATFDLYGQAVTMYGSIVGSPATSLPSVSIVDSIGGGSFAIYSAQTLGRLDATGGTVDVETTAGVSTGEMTIAGNATLAGSSNCQVSLGAGGLNYLSTASSAVDAVLTGTGGVYADRGAKMPTFIPDNNDSNAWCNYRVAKEGHGYGRRSSPILNGKRRVWNGDYAAKLFNIAA